jgi:putative radical SAM enzyme (TIGR03279 family)
VPGARISGISSRSPAARADLEVGDELVRVNGREPTDVIEYQQLVDGDHVALEIRRAGEGTTRTVAITKGPGEPLGLSIDSAVFDRIRTCDNHCSFCFIYQLPKGMRRSLYVKDDDFRLSFLYGNYTTLTRFTEFDLERVVEERLSPLFVSIHTTNPALRAEMLRNPRGATSLRWLHELLRSGIEVHGQVVVCPGVNDGVELERTLEDVVTSYPQLASLALVPVGVSDFSLEETMRPHRRDEARQVVELAQRYDEISRTVLGRSLVYASDEFYLVAGLAPPRAAALATLDLAENGIGMVAAFRDSFERHRAMPRLGSGFFQSVDGAPAWGYRAARAALSGPASGDPLTDGPLTHDGVVVLTGEYAAPLLRELLDEHGFDEVAVVPVVNAYFGGNIKVAGLLTGRDLAAALARVDPSATCLIPDVCLNEGRFLDGTTLEDLGRPVTCVRTTGHDLRVTLESLRAPHDVLVVS